MMFAICVLGAILHCLFVFLLFPGAFKMVLLSLLVPTVERFSGLPHASPVAIAKPLVGWVLHPQDRCVSRL